MKDIGVEVRFEREHISSFSGDGELMLTILASFAQEESRSISENIKWAIQKKYEKGQSHAARRCLGYRWENGHYVIVPEEAETVKLIFSLYLQGRNCVQIADELESRNIIGINGGRMGPCYIIEVLDNITYQGDMRFQREYSPNVGQSKRNYGEAPKFVLADAHEPIISRSDFEKTKRLRDQDRNIKGRRRTTCFSRKIFCAACGAMIYGTDKVRLALLERNEPDKAVIKNIAKYGNTTVRHRLVQVMWDKPDILYQCVRYLPASDIEKLLSHTSIDIRLEAALHGNREQCRRALTMIANTKDILHLFMRDDLFERMRELEKVDNAISFGKTIARKKQEMELSI